MLSLYLYFEQQMYVNILCDSLYIDSLRLLFNFTRSSVTRMSVEQKHNVMKNVDGQERATLDAKIPSTKEEEKAKSSSSSSCSEDEEEVESSESETGMSEWE